jgi:hypothetical protein
MIHDVDRDLASWVSSVAGDVDVIHDRPRDDVLDRPTVFVYLLALDHALPTQRSERRPLEISLRYMLTTGGADVEQAHRLLATLVFAALERADVHVDLTPLAPELWAAFGVAPRPTLILRRALIVERPARVGRVRSPAEINLTPARGLRGVVLTKAGVPVPHARVELPALKVSAYSGIDGWFDLGVVPEAAHDAPLRVVAKGTDALLPAERGDDGRLVIRFDPKET